MKKYPWITFVIDIRKLSMTSWIQLGECVSKSEHIRRTPLLPSVSEELHKIYLTKGVHATTAIEGNTLSEQQVRDIVDGKSTLPESKKYLEQENQNIIDACNDIGKAIADDKFGPVTVKLLCDYNRRVLNNVPVAEGAVPGVLRKYMVGVGTYKPPDGADIGGLLKKFCEWFNKFKTEGTQIEPIAMSIIKAITAHLYIAWIHPFGDGNGRTARLLEFAILLNSGVPSPVAHLLSNHYNATRNEYYRQLDRASKTGDVTEFFSYAICGLRDGLKEALDFLHMQVFSICWEHYVYEYFRPLGPSGNLKRQRNLLIEISRCKNPVTRAELQKLSSEIYLKAQKTKNSFTRDLNALIKRGLVVEKSGKYIADISPILHHLPFSRKHSGKKTLNDRNKI